MSAILLLLTLRYLGETSAVKKHKAELRQRGVAQCSGAIWEVISCGR